LEPDRNDRARTIRRARAVLVRSAGEQVRPLTTAGESAHEAVPHTFGTPAFRLLSSDRLHRLWDDRRPLRPARSYRVLPATPAFRPPPLARIRTKFVWSVCLPRLTRQRIMPFAGLLTGATGLEPATSG